MMKISWLSKKWVNVALHVLFWLLLFSLPYFLKPSENGSRLAHDRTPAYRDILFHLFFNCLTWVGLFYINAYFLIPKYFYQKRNQQYFLMLFLTLVALSIINWATFSLVMYNRTFNIKGLVFFYLFPCLFMIACSTAFVLFRDKMKHDKIASQRETENLKTELSFLRSQVSPHFMFNVLNNMVALARKGSDQLEPSLIKLSSLLRYMLYETGEDKVPLEKEIEYLQSYIDLQRQRFGKNLQINVALFGADGNYFIEPMLLIPFVENAFKHGVGLIEDPQIEVELKTKDHLLYFFVRNKFDEKSVEIKDKTSGIGLANVKRRLNLLYGNQHSLLISNDRGWFTVSLQMSLQ